jgi:hypothetical protein
MNNAQGTRHLSKAALAGLAVGGLTFGIVSFLAAATWDTATTATAATTTGATATAPTAAGNSTHHPKTTATRSTPNVLSTNWAGPVLTGDTYSQVATTFVVPQAKCSARSTDSSFWAGIDGAGTSPTVEQAGVRVSCGAHHAQYSAWTEEYPAPESDIDPSQFSVAPGDTVSVVVSAGAGRDTYTLTDVTSGATYTTSADAPRGAADDSAECVAEAPTGPNGIEKLTDFGTVTFSQCSATVAGARSSSSCDLVERRGCPSASQVTYSNIGTRKHHLTRLQAETMSTTGGAFTVTWHHS